MMLRRRWPSATGPAGAVEHLPAGPVRPAMSDRVDMRWIGREAERKPDAAHWLSSRLWHRAAEHSPVRANEAFWLTLPAELARGLERVALVAVDAGGIERIDRLGDRAGVDLRKVTPSRYARSSRAISGKSVTQRASPAITYSKNLLGSANSLCRELPGSAKKPISKAAASRTSAVIGTGGARVMRLEARAPQSGGATPRDNRCRRDREWSNRIPAASRRRCRSSLRARGPASLCRGRAP